MHFWTGKDDVYWTELLDMPEMAQTVRGPSTPQNDFAKRIALLRSG
jgi:hypothetical protein